MADDGDGYRLARMRARALSGGVEAQFGIADWTVTERFRYASMKADALVNFPASVLTPAQLAGVLSIPGAVFTYSGGPLNGQAFDTTSGTGLLVLGGSIRSQVPDADNMTNDLRASRVWTTGGGSLTTTAGIYKSRQNLKHRQLVSTILQDVQGRAGSSSVNIAAADGLFPVTQSGIISYSSLSNPSDNHVTNVAYDVTAPYGSFNFQKGRVSVGASLRYDIGSVEGDVLESRLGCFDFNGDGVTTPGTAECRTALFAGMTSRPVDYDYDYLSYSTGINFRVSDPFALFARYSKGARAGADAILYSSAISPQDGSLTNKVASKDPVKQAEGGFKYRNGSITFNVTGFYATTRETNTQVNQAADGLAQLQLVSRKYRAFGAEVEGGIRRGPFSLTGNATLVDAEITNAENPALEGNKPRHQPTLIYRVSPQYDTDLFSIGANVIGVTGSYAQDVNQLKLPAYATVGLYAQMRPVERLELSLNVTNAFNSKAITETLNSSIPQNNFGLARTLYGRLISTSARFFF